MMCADAKRLYIARRPDGALKIGISDNPNRRVKALSSAAGVRIELLADVVGGEVLEAALHRKFAAHRILGEWFKPALELQQLVLLLQCLRDEIQAAAYARVYAQAEAIVGAR
jgi:hypothetical protein